MQSRPSLPLVRLGEYELVRRIATGGMAEVYEARRPGPRGFAKRVALKRILPQLAMDDRLVRMFCAEARVHAALQHPNLVSVLDFGEADGELFLVMEYVDGVSLADVLRAVSARKRAIELGPALYIAREVAAGLAYAHQFRDEDDVPLGVVHRDVAPNNILLGRAGEVKVTDFGIVQSAWCDVRTAPGELRGKVGYVSPEQALGRGAEPRSDLFSLGVVLAEMLMGAPLIPGKGELEILRNLQRREWADLAPLASTLPPGVEVLLRRLLSETPSRRPSSAEQVAAELDRLASANGVRSSAYGMSLWLADLGIVRIESNIRVTPSRDDSPYRAAPPMAPARELQPTVVGEDAAKPLVIALPDPPASDEAPTLNRPVAGASPLRYRLRRPGGEVVGPLSLGQVLALLATARAGLDSELAREDGPFLKLSRAFELTRLASRPLYRFFDPVALMATERHSVERGNLASLLLRLALARRSGLIVHRWGADQCRIYLEQGVFTANASTDPSELLGSQLVCRGLVSEPDLERILESGYRSGCQLGESLVRASLISSEQLEQAVTQQRIRRLTRLCRAASGELYFIEGASSGETCLGLSQRPLAPLMEALRAAYPEQELEALLRGLSRTALRPSAGCAELRGAMCLSGDEAYAFDLALRGVKLGLVLREAHARGPGAYRAALFALFAGLSAGAFVAA